MCQFISLCASMSVFVCVYVAEKRAASLFKANQPEGCHTIADSGKSKVRIEKGSLQKKE